MTKNLIRPTLRSRYLRRLFIIFLLFTFVVAAGSFILKYTISQKLEKLSAQLNAPPRESEIGNLLLNLSSAENDFQQASLKGQSTQLNHYKQQLRSIFSQLDTVIHHYNSDSVSDFAGNKRQLDQLLTQKQQIAQNVFELRQRFDSLLNVVTITNINATHPEKLTLSTVPKNTAANDTTVSLKQETSKSGLLRRVKDAIVNKTQVKVLTIRQKEQKALAGSFTKQPSRALAAWLTQLKKQNGYVLQSNEQLIAANLNLLTELRQLLQQLKDIDVAAREKNREEVWKQYRAAARDLDTFTGVAISLVLLFIILLIYYIRKAGATEQRYFSEKERAVALAGQKSEILAIMSHEIRNKLMAITGAVFMLNKTKLSADQGQKVNAINLSSSMLIETVNNVLDVSKLEQQQPDLLLKVEFNPFAELKEAITSMRFMAEQKGITLTSQLDGNSEQLVTGDALRLKQVLINLLGNAIKYTDQGGVIVEAQIDSSGAGIRELSVSVKDTGPGIPKDQQAGLFSRYYQAHGAGRKPGTGLGLYLCDQLIRLQNGNIRVESEPGQGCTVYFSIPYPAATVDA